MSAPQRLNFLITSRTFPDTSDELEDELVKMYEEVSRAVNERILGIVEETEFPTGELWFNTVDPQKKRQTFRQAKDFEAINAGATQQIPHNIEGLVQVTKVYGGIVTDVVDYRPLPYVSASTVTDQVEVYVDSTFINIVNGSTAPNITSGIIVLEYLRN